MSDKLIGVAVSGATTEQVLGRIERSDQAGIPAAWMTTGGARLDSLTVFAAAAGRTKDRDTYHGISLNNHNPARNIGPAAVKLSIRSITPP